MSQIYVKANNDKQLQNLKNLFKKKNFKICFASGEYRFMPLLIDFNSKRLINITSATICNLLFNDAKKPLIDYKDFKTILNFTKE